jgi:hypothetical protein
MKYIQILISVLIITFGFSNQLIAQNLDNYSENLNEACGYFINDKKIPRAILLKLVPKNYEEFSKFYETTYPDNELSKTGFFYKTTEKIFNEVIENNNEDFYLPSLKLASFADGEYAEGFIEKLELIIKMDVKKFCKSIKDKDYAKQNPIEYYAELHNCE